MVFHVGGYYSTSSVVLCPPKNFKLKLLNYASQLKALFYGSTESSRLLKQFFSFYDYLFCFCYMAREFPLNRDFKKR